MMERDSQYTGERTATDMTTPHSPSGPTGRALWMRGTRVALLLLIVEKVAQHIVVTTAFALDVGRIRASVALDYRLFLVSGAALTLLFALSGWALVRERAWARGLIIALALADIIGEFVAQGTLAITLTVSVVAAAALLLLALLYRAPARE